MFFNESSTHFSGKSEEVGVSGDFFRRFSNKKFFFKDALGHFFKMIFEVLFVGLQFRNGSFEFGFKSVVGILSSRFVVGEFSKRVFDVVVELFKHTSNSANGTSIKEHIEFRSGHLGEESNDWSVVVRKVNFDTSSKEEGSVLRELSEGTFFSDHIVEDTEGTFDNTHGVSVIRSSGNKESVFFFSGCGGNSKSGFRVGDVLDGLSKINFGFISGVFTGGEVVRGSS